VPLAHRGKLVRQTGVYGPYCHGHHLRSRNPRSLVRLVEDDLP
jgi:hypothetical protein